MNKKILKESGILLIVTIMILSSVSVSNTNGNVSSLDPETPFVNDDIDEELMYYSPSSDPRFPPIPGDMSVPPPKFEIPDISIKVPDHHEITLSWNSDLIIDFIQQLNETMYLGYLENLTAFGPRRTGTSACESAGAYLYNELESMGLEVRYHNWSSSSYSARNIEGTLVGLNETSDEIYIVCGHYDTVSGSPGADDDGSGTVAVLAAAYIMSQYAVNHTVRFVAFSGEEQGLLGSREYAQDAYENGDNIVGVLNADMIGYALTSDHGSNIKIYENTASHWLTDFTDDVSQLYCDYIDLNIIPSGTSGGSDHYSFWQYGYDAIFYHEYKFNDYYHSSQDTIDNMNVTYAVKVSKLILATLSEVAQACLPSNPPDTPIISGPSSGIVEQSLEFTIVTTDPDGDDVYYYIDWGDKNYSKWIGPYESGQTITASHSWTEIGDYNITVKAKDIYDVEGNWSNPLVIYIVDVPILEIGDITGGLFKINVVIKNIGSVDATGVDWSITLDGGVIMGKETAGRIMCIPAGENVIVSSDLILGIGKTVITVTADTHESSDTKEQDAFILFFFIKI